MNQKLKFTYEDAVNYVLGRLSDEKKKIFEEELKINSELNDMVRLANSNKERIMEVKEFELKEEFVSLLLKKAKNILSETEVKRGLVFKIDERALNYVEKMFFEDLYFIVLTNPEESLSGKDVRVVPLSTLTQYVQNYDLVFTDNLISTKNFNVVAHMHLVTNMPTDKLKYFIGELKWENFNAIVHADLNDYSLINNETILKGSEYRKRFPIDPYFDEEYDSWYSILKNLLDKFRIETIEMAEEEIEVQEVYAFRDLSLDKKPIFSLIMKEFPPLRSKDKFARVKSKYRFDTQGFLIVEDKKHILTNKYQLEVRKKSLNISELDYDKVKQKVYEKISDEVKENMKENLLSKYKLMIQDYSDYVPKYKALKLVAKQSAFQSIPENSLSLYEDPKLSIYFSFYDDRLFIEINFLENEKIEIIENFHFIFLADSTGFFIPSIKVEFYQVKIPLDFSKGQIENLQEGYIVGFTYNKVSFVVHLRLLLH